MILPENVANWVYSQHSTVKYVEISLRPDAAMGFLDFTRANVGKSVLIVWEQPNDDGKSFHCQTASLKVTEPIADGQIHLTIKDEHWSEMHSPLIAQAHPVSQ